MSSDSRCASWAHDSDIAKRSVSSLHSDTVRKVSISSVVGPLARSSGSRSSASSTAFDTSPDR
jgi:hypothetical protein